MTKAQIAKLVSDAVASAMAGQKPAAVKPEIKIPIDAIRQALAGLSKSARVVTAGGRMFVDGPTDEPVKVRGGGKLIIKYVS
jgi:hypothetical protein